MASPRTLTLEEAQSTAPVEALEPRKPRTLSLEEARAPRTLSLAEANSETTLPPPPSPQEVGIQQQAQVGQQALAQMHEDFPAGSGSGKTVFPNRAKPLYGFVDPNSTAGKVAEWVASTKQFNPADVVMPLAGAEGVAAKGAGNWLRRRFGTGGYEQAAEHIVPPATRSAEEILGRPTFPMRTASADIEVGPQVVRKQTPPTIVPPSHQLPPATQRMPAATLPEAYRAVPAEAAGRREMSLDDVRSRIALLESEKPANPLHEAQIQQELGEFHSYLQPEQPSLPIPNPSGKQGELWTGGRIDVKPESKVYGAGPEDVERLSAQGELRRAEEASSRALPKTPKTPPAYQPTLSRELESIGYEVAPKSKQPTSGVALVSPESAVSTYPALKRIATRITQNRVRESEIQRELTTLSQSAPTRSNISRTEKLTKELDSIAQSRATNKLTSADENEIVSTVERMEAELPKAELGASEYSTRTSKARGMTKQQAAESIDESVRGPRYAPPLAPKPPTGATASIGGLREPGFREPPAGAGQTPEKFSATKERETINAPGPLAGARMPQENIRYVGGSGATNIADNIERGLAEGGASGSRRFYKLNKQGLLKLDDAEDLNVTEILESGGKVAAISPRAQTVADTGKAVLADVMKEAGSATPGGTPIMVRSQDGSIQIISPLKDYFPHHVPALHVLKDSSNPLRGKILDAAVKRGDFPDLGVADTALSEYVKYVEGKTDRPSTLLTYLHRSNPNTSEQQILKLMEKLRSAKPGEYGALEQHRTIDLPFYDPSAKGALGYYIRHASHRLALTRRLGQQGEVISAGLKQIENSIVKGGGKRPEDVAEFVRGEVDKLLGQVKTDKDWDALSASYRTDQAFKIGPITTLANSFQATMFGYTKTDLPTLIKGWAGLMSKAGRERAYEGGANIEQALHLSKLESGFDEPNYLLSRAHEMKQEGVNPIERKFYAYRGWKSKIKGEILTRYMHYDSFGHSELMQRIIGHNMGEAWATKMTKRLAKNPGDTFAINELNSLHLNPAEIVAQGGKLTDDQALLAGASMSDNINFSGRPEHLPSGAQGAGSRSAIGKLMLQFKNFGINAAKLSYQGTFGNIIKGKQLAAVGDPAANKYLWRGTRNLLYMATVFPASGELVGTARTLILQGPDAVRERYGDDWEKKIAKRWVLNAGEIGAFGIFFDSFRSAGYGKLAESLLGPTAGKDVEISEIVGRETLQTAAGKGDPDRAVRALVKWALKNGTMTGTLLKPYLEGNKIYPYDKQPGEGAGRLGRSGRSGR